MPEKRNWKEYYEEIEKMNKGKGGRPYEYPESFAIFMYCTIAFI